MLVCEHVILQKFQVGRHFAFITQGQSSNFLLMKVEHYTTYKTCSLLIAYTGIDFEHFVVMNRKILYFTCADQKYVNPSMVIKLMVTNPHQKS